MQHMLRFGRMSVHALTPRLRWWQQEPQGMGRMLVGSQRQRRLLQVVWGFGFFFPHL